MIKTIVFDINGVLFGGVGTSSWDLIERISGKSKDEIKAKTDSLGGTSPGV